MPRTNRSIEEWLRAGLIDPATADRLLAFEARRSKGEGARWPVLLAWIFGGVLLGAGVLLFVAAHWEELSPGGRFALVLLLVASFHLAAGLVGTRHAALASVLHAVGTVALGAGIFLSGQIFHLAEHWPGGFLLWALGAWAAWGLLRDWPQAALAALLTPAWLVGEWVVATEGMHGAPVLGTALALLSATYLSARMEDSETRLRRALAWIGGIALIPCVLSAVASSRWRNHGEAVPTALFVTGWVVALGLPMLLALLLRRRAAWMNGVAAVWATGLATFSGVVWGEFGIYLWCMLGSAGLVAWGIHESRPERVNLGIAGFGITVATFYFSEVMDKLGRSISLICLGLLFLVGGWVLARLRRRLVALAREEPT